MTSSMPPFLRAVAVLLATTLFSFVGFPVAKADDAVDVRSELARFKKEFPKAKTAPERIALIRALPDATDTRVIRTIIETLEKSLKAKKRLRKEYDAARKKLAPYLGKDLLEAEWQTRDSLEADAAEIAAELVAEDDVALAFVDMLVAQESDEGVEFLADWALRNRSWRIRAEVVQALGRMHHDKARETVVIATEDRDPRVRQIAVEAAGRKGGKDVEEYLILRLSDDEWPVRAAAIEALVKRKSEICIGPLILRMGEENGRLRDDCAKALEKLTGQTFGLNVMAWRKWWAENHLEPLDEAASIPRMTREAVSFHDIKTSSQAMMFVVDISDSMNEAASSSELTDSGVGVRDGVERSKFDVMMKELIQSISMLPPKAMFNLIVYNHEVTRWKDKMQPASKKMKNEALEYLFSVQPIGGTNVFDSLELAFESAGLGAQDRYYRPLVDTIYFLSDGAPSAGRFTDPTEILKHIDRMNRFRRVTVHSIGIGKLHDKAFMKRLADAHGGRYVQRL